MNYQKKFFLFSFSKFSFFCSGLVAFRETARDASFVGFVASLLLCHHFPELCVAEPTVAVRVEPGEDLVDLLLRQVLGQLLHLGLGDVAVLVLVVELEGQLGLKLHQSRKIKGVYH